jgi:septal ring factor EnvC (AmiA/AmiB activator)
MSRANKALIVLVVASLGLWGCARGPANNAVSLERIKALESKIAKLEDDFRASVAVRDQLKKKLTAVEEERTQLAKERDEVRQQLGTVQERYEQFRKGVKTLLGQAEQLAPLQPVTAVNDAPTPGKS